MNDKLNIQDLVDMLAEKHGMSKKNADSFVKEFFQLIEEALEKDKYVKVKGLGTFKLIDVESRESVNVNTGERFEIQGHTKVSFAPEPTLKDIINKPFSHFETVVLNDDTVLEDTPVDGENDEDEETIAPVPETPAAISEEVPTADAEVTEKPIEVEVTETSAEVEITEKQEVETPPVTATEKAANSSTMRCFIGIVAFVVLICTGAVAYLYSPDLFDNLMSQPPTEEIIATTEDKPADKTVMTDSIVAKDTVQAIPVDTIKETLAHSSKETDAPKETSNNTVRKQETTASAPSKEQKKTVAAPVKPDSLGYTIVGTETTYTVREGETLTKVALRFYGTKALWPYIVKHNPGVIKNPNNVPYGTKIRIPKLTKKQ